MLSASTCFCVQSSTLTIFYPSSGHQLSANWSTQPHDVIDLCDNEDKNEQKSQQTHSFQNTAPFLMNQQQYQQIKQQQLAAGDFVQMKQHRYTWSSTNNTYESSDVVRYGRVFSTQSSPVHHNMLNAFPQSIFHCCNVLWYKRQEMTMKLSKGKKKPQIQLQTVWCIDQQDQSISTVSPYEVQLVDMNESGCLFASQCQQSKLESDARSSSVNLSRSAYHSKQTQLVEFVSQDLLADLILERDNVQQSSR